MKQYEKFERIKNVSETDISFECVGSNNTNWLR